MQLHYGQLWQGKALQCDITAIQQTGPPRNILMNRRLLNKTSIEKHGVLQRAFASECDDSLVWSQVNGVIRHNTGRLQNLPAVFTDGEPAEISIVENLLRENLTAIEEAEAIERLRSLHNYALADLAAALGKSDSTLSEILSLNKLPAAVKDDCRNDPKAGRTILALIARQKTDDNCRPFIPSTRKAALHVERSERKPPNPNQQTKRLTWHLLINFTNACI